MSGWHRTMLAMSAKGFDLQDAMTALQRLLRDGAVRPTTRVVLDGAMKALELETELAPGQATPPSAGPAGQARQRAQQAAGLRSAGAGGYAVGGTRRARPA